MDRINAGSPREHYMADATIVWCFDNRFWGALQKLVQKRGFRHFDPVIVAGGAKSLASPVEENDRRFLLSQIRTSLKLHRPKEIILMVHSDCGAYGGLAAFDNDVSAEFAKLSRDLRAAARLVQTNIGSEIPVRLVFADFEGLRFL